MGIDGGSSRVRERWAIDVCGRKFLMRLGGARFGKQVSTEEGYGSFTYSAGICQIEALAADGGFGDGSKWKFGVVGVEVARA